MISVKDKYSLFIRALRFCWCEQIRAGRGPVQEVHLHRESWGPACWGIQHWSEAQSYCPGSDTLAGQPAIVQGIFYMPGQLDGLLSHQSIPLPWGKCSSNLADSGPAGRATHSLCFLPRRHVVTSGCCPVCNNIVNTILTRTNFCGQNICWFPALATYMLLCALNLMGGRKRHEKKKERDWLRDTRGKKECLWENWGVERSGCGWPWKEWPVGSSHWRCSIPFPK